MSRLWAATLQYLVYEGSVMKGPEIAVEPLASVDPWILPKSREMKDPESLANANDHFVMFLDIHTPRLHDEVFGSKGVEIAMIWKYGRWHYVNANVGVGGRDDTYCTQLTIFMKFDIYNLWYFNVC